MLQKSPWSKSSQHFTETVKEKKKKGGGGGKGNKREENPNKSFNSLKTVG